jgi:integrase
LSDCEIAAFWRACDQMGYPFGPLFQLLLLTGARRTELAAAEWDEIDLAARTWTVPRERAKADCEHRIPLTSSAMALLNTLPRCQSGPHVFSTTFGRRPVSRLQQGCLAAAAADAGRTRRRAGLLPP